LFAEACRGDKDFDADFKRLMRDPFPDNKLERLPAAHPVWQASGKFTVTDYNRFPLYGINQGCKTVVIYSPRPLAGYWEANLFDQPPQRGDGRMAFRLGANVVAYATGLEPLKPRLTQAELVSEEP